MSECPNSVLRNAIFDYLFKNEFHTVTVTYNGAGDSGSIEEMLGVEELTRLPKEIVDEPLGNFPIVESFEYSPDFLTKTPVYSNRELTTREAIETICYSLLEQDFGGWEINEGSQGEFTFEVDTRILRLSHGENYVEVNTSEMEY